MSNIITEYGSGLLSAVLSVVVTAIAVWLRGVYSRHVNDSTKRNVAHTVVTAVEQIYKDLHGDEKLEKALTAAAGMLADKGVKVTELELRMLIESAVGEFNGAFGGE